MQREPHKVSSCLITNDDKYNAFPEKKMKKRLIQYFISIYMYVYIDYCSITLTSFFAKSSNQLNPASFRVEFSSFKTLLWTSFC